MMRYLSCFSGIEAASVAWLPLGWTCVGVAEVEPFPCAVLAHHYPDVPNLGDVTADDFLQRAVALRPDVLVGGPPCQDFSVPGLRAGLGGDRGNLSLRWVEIVRAIRPAFAVTENVPGWLSVNGGHAFGAFLAGLVGHDTALVPPRNCGGRWTNAGMVAGPLGRVAWRVLDAQYFGLAQRRQRVFAVFCPRDGADPAAVLFEPASLRWDSPPRRETREGTTGTLSSRATAGGGLGTDFECSGGVVAGTIEATMGRSRGAGTPPGYIIPLQEISKRTGVSTDDPRAGIGIGQEGDPMFTLQAGAQHGIAVAPRGREGGGLTVEIAPNLRAQSNSSHRADSEAYVAVARPLTANREGGGVAELGDDCAHAIRASQGGGDKPHVLAFDLAQITSATNRTTVRPGQPASTLNGSGDMHVAIDLQNCALGGDVAGTLDTTRPTRGGGQAVMGAAVRRLTPTECCRLQGFPDTYLDITYRGRPAADGPKYRALGNSFAVPVIRWIGSRIAAQETEIQAQRAQTAA